MKRNPEFLLREVAGSLVAVPVGAATAAFPGMITLNSTGAYIWELLETEQTIDSLTAAIVARYAVTAQVAQADVRAFVERLIPTGAILED
jgi:hypothetical protein